MIKYIFILLLLSSFSFSQTNIYVPKPNEFNNLQEEKRINDNFKNIEYKNINQENSSTIELNDEDLKSNIQLTAAFLDEALENNNWELVEHLIKIYSEFEKKDEILLHFAQARLNHSKENYRLAIKQYEKALVFDSNLSPVRLYLVQALIENKEYEKAKTNISKIKEDKNLPNDILKIIENYNLHLKDVHSLKTNVYVNYISDKNINETSNDKYIKIGNKLFERSKDNLPQKGKGFAYGLSLEKKFNIIDNHNIRTSFQDFGKYYYNNKDYNDNISRFNFGYNYEDGTKNINILPFFQKRIFGNKSYSKTYGVLFNNDFSLNKDLNISPLFEYGKISHKKSDFLDAYYYFTSFGLNYILNDKTILFTNYSFYDYHAKDKSESFDRNGIKFGFYRTLPYDIILKSDITFAKKLYRNDENMFNIKRDDNETLFNNSIWHRNLQIFSLTPKINFEYEKIKSNTNIYSYKKTRYYLSLEKSF